MAQDEVRRLVRLHRLAIAPVPKFAQDRQTAAVEFVRPFDAPDLVGVRHS